MNKEPIFIGYYTVNTPYEEEAKKYLISSLKKFNLDYDVQGVPDLGNWQKNTGFKSTFILNKLHKHQRPVVFLDADAEVLKYPTLFYNIPDEYDLGIHWLDWYKMWRKQEGNPRRDLLSGTMYVPCKDTTINLIKEFIKEVKDNPDIWEQKAMQQVVERRKDLKIYELPYSYITFPLQNGDIPKHMVLPKDIVILHHQASRRLKNRHNWK